MHMENKFHIAVVQAEQQMYDCDKNVQRGLEFIKQAKEMGADLVLFPECWIQGYRMPLLYEEKTLEELFEMKECGMTWEEIEENSAYQEWKEEALELTDARIQVFCEKARELSIGIVLTCYTKGKKRPRNSAIVIDKTGKILMQYDKVHTCDFSLECLLEKGETFNVCDFHGIKLGIMICYDREYPESARELMLKGAEIILVPNACSGMRPRVNVLETRAYENMVGVVMANYAGENMGNSCAFSPIPWDENGYGVDMTLFKAEETKTDIYMATYHLEQLRNYREHEMMGATFRNVNAYEKLLEQKVEKPFLRKPWIPTEGKEGGV